MNEIELHLWQALQRPPMEHETFPLGWDRSRTISFFEWRDCPMEERPAYKILLFKQRKA